MIDHFEIRVPAVVEAGVVFEITVLALDAQGALLTGDSTTVVKLIPSDPDLVFDGNGDGTFGGLGDDLVTLTGGVAVFPAKDTKSSTFTLDVTDTQGRTGSKVLAYSFNCLPIPRYDTLPAGTVDTRQAYRFFDTRDKALTAVEPGLLAVASTALRFSDRVKVFNLQPLRFQASDITVASGLEVPSLPNTDVGGSQFTQVVAGSQAIYNQNAILGKGDTLRFSTDFYEEPVGILGENQDFVILAGVSLLQSGGSQTLFAQYINATTAGSTFLFRYSAGFEVVLGADGTLPQQSLKSSVGTVGQPTFVVIERIGDTYVISVDGVQEASFTDATGSRQIAQVGNLIGARGSSVTLYNGSPTDFYEGDLLSLDIIPGFQITAQGRLRALHSFQDAYTNPWLTSTAYVSYLGSTYTAGLLLTHDETLVSPYVRDYSGSGVNAEVLGTPTRGVSAICTDGGQAFSYGASVFSKPQGFNSGGSQAHSFHFWVRTAEPNAVTADSGVLFSHSTSLLTIYWHLSEAGTYAGTLGFFDSGFKDFGVSLPRDGQPHLVSFTFGSSVATLYLDGVSQGTQAYANRTLAQASTLLRAYYDGSKGAEGQLDMDVVLYSPTVHTGPQVLDIYTQGSV